MFRNIQQKKCVRISFYESKGQKREDNYADYILSALFCCAIVLLLGVSCLFTFKSVFTVEGRMGGYAALLLFASLILGILYSATKKTLIPTVAVGGVYLLVMWGCWKYAVTGGKRILNEILFRLNDYLALGLSGWSENELRGSDNRIAILLVLFLLLWWIVIGLLRVKRLGWIAAPVLLLTALDLMVGEAPDMAAVASFGIGLASSAAFCDNGKAAQGAKKKIIQVKAAFFLCIAASGCFLSASGFGMEQAELFTRQHDRIIAYQHQAEDYLMNLELVSGWGNSEGKVSNVAPVYEQKEVLSVRIDGEKPQETVYLRGYVGDTYQSGRWVNSSINVFEDAVQSWPVDESRIGKTIMSLPYRNEAGHYSSAATNLPSFDASSPGFPVNKYTITYVDTDDSYAYFPYFTDLESEKNAEEISVLADAMVERGKAADLDVTGAIVSQNIPVYRYGYPYDAGGQSEGIGEYEEYVKEHYLAVPAALRQINALGEELKQKMEKMYGFVQDNPEGFKEQISPELLAVYLVKETIAAKTSYSLNLREVPQGEDVTQYFLFGSGKGFCQQYASAGVLLLRKMGVPARYATGYAVTANQFERYSNADLIAHVKDSSAHAWVEYYVEGTGWIPADMTEGANHIFSEMQIYSDKEDESLYITYGEYTYFMTNRTRNYEEEDYEEIIDKAKERIDNGWTDYAVEFEEAGEEEETEIETEASQSETTPGPDATDTQKTDNTLTSTEKDSQMAETDSNRKTEEGNASDTLKNEGNQSDGIGLLGLFGESGKEKNSVAAVCVILLLMICVGLILLSIIRIHHRYVWKSFHQKNARSAVKSISYRTYRLMHHKGMVRGQNIDDCKFEAVIRASGLSLSKEEMDCYFAILRRAAYSEETITQEEAAFCRKVYQMIKFIK